MESGGSGQIPSGCPDFLDFQLAGMAVSLPEIMGHLQTQPGLGSPADCLGQAAGHLRRPSALAIDDLTEGLPGHAEDIRSRRDTEIKRLQAIVANRLTRVGWIVHRHKLQSPLNDNQ